MFKNEIQNEFNQKLEHQIQECIDFFENENDINVINENEQCKAAKASMEVHKEKAKEQKNEFKNCKKKNGLCKKAANNADNKTLKKQRLMRCKEKLSNCMEPIADAIQKHKDEYKKQKEKAKENCLGSKILKGLVKGAKGAGKLAGKGSKKLGSFALNTAKSMLQ